MKPPLMLKIRQNNESNIMFDIVVGSRGFPDSVLYTCIDEVFIFIQAVRLD